MNFFYEIFLNERKNNKKRKKNKNKNEKNS